MLSELLGKLLQQGNMDARSVRSAFVNWCSAIKLALAPTPAVFKILEGTSGSPLDSPVQGAWIWIPSITNVPTLIALNDMYDTTEAAMGQQRFKRNDPVYRAYRIVDTLKWYKMFPPSEGYADEAMPAKSDI